MRQISILEVLDPFTNKYIKVSEAIGKGIFDRNTYQYFDPIQQKIYSITDAAKNGLYKTCVNNDPNCLVLEKIRVAQTLSLKSAIDPENTNRRLKIKDAIKRGIIDLDCGVYRNFKTKEAIQLSDAIELGLVESEIVKESYEKIKETLIEKTQENENRDSIETYTEIVEDVPIYEDKYKKLRSQQPPRIEENYYDDASSCAGNSETRSIYFDQTKFEETNAEYINTSTLHNQITAALIKDSKSNRIIDLQSAVSNGIINTTTGLYYDSKSNNQIDLSKAIDRGLVILPDSDCLLNGIDSVLDTKTGNFVDFQTALKSGIIDTDRRLFKNTKKNLHISLFEALSNKFIRLNGEETSDRDDNSVTYDDIHTVFDPSCGEQIDKSLAIRKGLLNNQLNAYIEPKTKRFITLTDAYRKGLIVLNDEDREKTVQDEEVMRIKGVYDPQTGEKIHLKDAIQNGMLDYTEGFLYLKTTGEKLSLEDAYERGYLITATNTEQKQKESIESFKEFLTGLKTVKTSETTNSASILSLIKDEDANLTIHRTNSSSIDDSSSDEDGEEQEDDNESTFNSDVDSDDELDLNAINYYTSSQQDDQDMIKLYQKEINALNKTDSPDTIPVVDLYEIPKRPILPQQSSTESAAGAAKPQLQKSKSIIMSLKDKVFGAKKPQPLMQNGYIDEQTIIDSLIYYDRKNLKEYDLTKAIEKHLILSANCIIDTRTNSELTIKDALSKSILYFSIADSIRLTKLDNSFYNDKNLYIIYYVLDLQTKMNNKLTLYEAIRKGILNRTNATFTHVQRSQTLNLPIEDAIERGYVSGAIVNLKLLHNILTKYTNEMYGVNDDLVVLVNRYEKNTNLQEDEYVDDEDENDENEEEDVSTIENTQTKTQTHTPSSNLDNIDWNKIESLDDVIRDVIRSECMIVSNNRVPPSIVRKLPKKKYDRSKRFVINGVYDKAIKSFVNFEDAVCNGIYNSLTHEYLNSSKGKVYKLKKAIRKGFVKIVEYQDDDEPQQQQQQVAESDQNNNSNIKTELSSRRQFQLPKFDIPQPDVQVQKAQSPQQQQVETIQRKMENFKVPITRAEVQTLKPVVNQKEEEKIQNISSIEYTESIKTDHESSECYEERVVIKPQVPQSVQPELQHRPSTVIIKTTDRPYIKVTSPPQIVDSTVPLHRLERHLNEDLVLTKQQLETFSKPTTTEPVKVVINKQKSIDETVIAPVANPKPIQKSKKSYLIISCYDTLNKETVPVEKAVKCGIFNPATDEFYDTKARKMFDIERAIQDGKVKIQKFTTTTKRANSVDSTKNPQLNIDQSRPISQKQQSEIAKPIEAQKPILKQQHETVQKMQSAPVKPIQTNQQTCVSDKKTEKPIDLVKYIVYYVPNENKNIDFEEVIERNLYDPRSCKIKNLNTNEYLNFNEALLKSIIKLTNPNIIYDKFNLYVIDGVLNNNGELITLNDAVHAEGILNKDMCTYKHKRTLFTIQIAINEGLIRGRIIDFNQLKTILNQYYEDLCRKKDVSDNLLTVNDAYVKRKLSPNPVNQLKSSKTTTDVDVVDNKGLFERVRVFDGYSQSYTPLANAIKAGLVDMDTGKIKESRALVFIPFKEAIVNGLISTYACQHRSAFFMHKDFSYIIDAIYDPVKKVSLSISDSVRNGLFANGVYRNPLNGKAYDIDEALETGVYMIGKKINLNTVENDFMEYLKNFKLKLEIKKTNERLQQQLQEQLQKQQKQEVKQAEELVKKPVPTVNAANKIPTISNAETVSISKIKSVKDVRTGRAMPSHEGERIGLLSLSQGWFKNSNTMEILQISDAIDRGFIQLETITDERIPIESLDSVSVKTTGSSVSTNRNQFVITSILDPLRKIELNVDEAIKQGLFDISNAFYTDPITKKRYNMVEAVDQGYIKIADNMQASYKVSVQRDDYNGSRIIRNLRTYSIRYVVDLSTNHIIPIATAIKLNIVNLETGILYDKNSTRKLSIMDAYNQGLAYTINDLDNPLADRCPFQIELVRNCNNGKEMSLKSALTKNWISITRRVYINKYSGQHMPLSQALDMDLIVMTVNNDYLLQQQQLNKHQKREQEQYKNYARTDSTDTQPSNEAKMRKRVFNEPTSLTASLVNKSVDTNRPTNIIRYVQKK